MMNRPSNYSDMNGGNPWAKLVTLCQKLLDALPGHSEPALLTLWTYRGGGKTTFLHSLSTALAAPEVAVVGLWDVAAMEVDRTIQEILHAVEASSRDKKVILLDNLDASLRLNDGQGFFELEQELVLELLERPDVLLITTSQIPITTQWREYNVRIRQENRLIPPLREEQIAQIEEAMSSNTSQLLARSRGYPQVLAWLKQEPCLSEVELAQRVTDYFLAGLPDQTRELALVASLLPLFDIAVLRDLLTAALKAAKSDGEQEGFYADYVDHIRELIGTGLVAWDMQVGAYRFCNAAVRRLLAQSLQALRPNDFKHIHQVAAQYYQEESRRAGYLHYTLVSAIYHIAQAQYIVDPATVGDHCLRWVRNNLETWMGADWAAVVDAWRRASGDEAVRKELNILLGDETIDEITQLLEGAKQAMEVLQ